VEDLFSALWWGAPDATGPTRPRRARRGLAFDLLPAASILGLWVLLWSSFIVAVAGPAARLHRAGELTRQPAIQSAGTLTIWNPGEAGERSEP